MKRKRELEEEAAGKIEKQAREEKESCFQRSKITPRSPVRKGEGKEALWLRWRDEWRTLRESGKGWRRA